VVDIVDLVSGEGPHWDVRASLHQIHVGNVDRLAMLKVSAQILSRRSVLYQQRPTIVYPSVVYVAP